MPPISSISVRYRNNNSNIIIPENISYTQYNRNSFNPRTINGQRSSTLINIEEQCRRDPLDLRSIPLTSTPPIVPGSTDNNSPYWWEYAGFSLLCMNINNHSRVKPSLSPYKNSSDGYQNLKWHWRHSLISTFRYLNLCIISFKHACSISS